MHPSKILIAGGAFAAAALAAPAAHAANPACSAAGVTGTTTTVVYVGGSTAVTPTIKAIDQALVNGASSSIIVFADAMGQTGSCTGTNFFLADTDPNNAAACPTGGCPTGTGEWYDGTGTKVVCDLPTPAAHLDVVMSDVFMSSCPGAPTTLPADAQDTTDFIQAMLFVIPKNLATPQQAITAEEAYFVFGFGGSAGMASPWLDVTVGLMHQAIRNKGSGTQQMVGRASGLPGDYINQGKMKGFDEGGSGGVVTAVGTSTDPTEIGILSMDQYDAHRDTLRSLAFKNFHQWFAYYADSTATSFDKANVRDGHYWIWGPEHFFTRMNGTATVRPNAQVFLDLIKGKTPITGTTILDVEIAAHVVPECAMKVQRSTEVGPISKFAPATPCGCYFEFKATGTNSCTACTDPDGTACAGGGVCRHKFCEAN
jgi:ABC-type phosphate transport system substrate-binding protein